MVHFQGNGGGSVVFWGGGNARLVPYPANPPATKMPAPVMKLRREIDLLETFSIATSILPRMEMRLWVVWLKIDKRKLPGGGNVPGAFNRDLLESSPLHDFS